MTTSDLPRIDKATVRKFDRPGPRYTSYPTAPVWDSRVNETVYRNKLRRFGESDKTLSLYVHIPFCQTLCSYCACNVVVRKQEDRHGDEYLDHIGKEIEMVSAAIGRAMPVKQLHWGGGTPTFLNQRQIERLHDKISRHFAIEPDAETAIEIDPRTIDRPKLQTLRRLGFNRASLGVQDFNFEVMAGVNRFQTYDMVKELYYWCRELDFKSINFDLIYGLPGQSAAIFSDTADRVAELAPDRIALYSFAYLPDLKKHQKKFSARGLPTADAKLEMFLNAREIFLKKGYAAVAMDHFARQGDEMARAFRKNRLYRNFMGYTVKPADEFIGLGLTAIGFLEKTFTQNVKVLPAYYEQIKAGRLPVERGMELDRDDEIRQYVITQLMCHFYLSKTAFREKFGLSFDEYFQNESGHLNQCQKDGLLGLSDTDIRITGTGKIFIRNVCMGFDRYLRQPRFPRTFSNTV
jgi:oxygen-independent coproporphyrinogen-3 oxidase